MSMDIRIVIDIGRIPLEKEADAKSAVEDVCGFDKVDWEPGGKGSYSVALLTSYQKDIAEELLEAVHKVDPAIRLKIWQYDLENPFETFDSDD